MSEHIVGLTMMTAAALGLLSFFEPCTIATHTLFSARAHADLRAARHGALLGLWITRSAFNSSPSSPASPKGPFPLEEGEGKGVLMASSPQWRSPVRHRCQREESEMSHDQPRPAHRPRRCAAPRRVDHWRRR